MYVSHPQGNEHLSYNRRVRGTDDPVYLGIQGATADLSLAILHFTKYHTGNKW
jgi:hypothetical protein